MRIPEIEQRVAQLSLDERLWLIEPLAQPLRENSDIDNADMRRELEEMANHPENPRELKAINTEFAVT